MFINKGGSPTLHFSSITSFITVDQDQASPITSFALHYIKLNRTNIYFNLSLSVNKLISAAMSERGQNLPEVSTLQSRDTINTRHLQLLGPKRCMRCIEYNEERCIMENLTTCRSCYLAQGSCLFARTIERIGAANTFGPEELSNEYIPQMALPSIQQFQHASETVHGFTPHTTPSLLRESANPGETVRGDSSDLFLPPQESSDLPNPPGFPIQGSYNIRSARGTGALRSSFGATTEHNIESSKSASRRHQKKHQKKHQTRYQTRSQTSNQTRSQTRSQTRDQIRSQTRDQIRSQSTTQTRRSITLPIDPRITGHNISTPRNRLTAITGITSEHNTGNGRVPVKPGKVLGLGACYSCRVRKTSVSFTKIKR